MTGIVKFGMVALFMFFFNNSFGQTKQTITGKFQNQLTNAVNCNCNVQAYVLYTASDGKSYNLTVCFDSEPGDFYQIYDGEEVTLHGNTSSKTCANGKKYRVLDVTKSQLNPSVQRQMIYPELTKRQGSNNAVKTKQSTSNASQDKIYTMSGSFILRGSTMDDWSLFDGVNCNACGLFYDRKDVIVNFDRIGVDADALYNVRNIKVYGTYSGNTLTVTRWEKIN